MLGADVLDGAMIVLAIYTLNVVHPGIFIGYNMSAKSGKVDEGSTVQLAERGV